MTEQDDLASVLKARKERNMGYPFPTLFVDDPDYVLMTKDGRPVWAVELAAALKELSKALWALAEAVKDCADADDDGERF